MHRGLALALLLTGCDGTDRAPPPVLPSPGCATDAVCSSGLSCVEGGCVGEDAPSGGYQLRVRAGSDTPYAEVDLLSPIVFGAAPVRRLGAVHVPLRQEIAGRVTLGEHDIQAKVTAVALEGITDPPLQFRADEVDGPAFVLDLAPAWPRHNQGARAVPFQLRVSPPSETLPPFDAPPARLEPTVELVLPAEPLRRLSGHVLRSEENTAPVREVTVRAFVDDRLVSTTAVTDETGAFTLGFWPDGPDEVTLRTQSTLPEFPWPALAQTVNVSDGEVLVFVGDVSSTFEATGIVRAEDDQVAPETRLVFRAPVGNGVFTTTATTDAEGLFRVDLYEGVYLIDVQPPPPHRLALLERTLTAGDGPLEIAAAPRVRIDGCLEDWGGVRVEGATVSTRLIEPAYGDPELDLRGSANLPDRVVTGQTSDANGQFTLNVDGGVHRLTITPPVDRGLPTMTVPLDPVSPDTGTVDLGRNGCIILPPAAVITADLVGADGEAVTGAAVEAWRTGPDGAAKVAQATSDAAGHVVLVLPNR